MTSGAQHALARGVLDRGEHRDAIGGQLIVIDDRAIAVDRRVLVAVDAVGQLGGWRLELQELGQLLARLCAAVQAENAVRANELAEVTCTEPSDVFWWASIRRDLLAAVE